MPENIRGAAYLWDVRGVLVDNAPARAFFLLESSRVNALTPGVELAAGGRAFSPMEVSDESLAGSRLDRFDDRFDDWCRELG
jgi:hypothetical protein